MTTANTRTSTLLDRKYLEFFIPTILMAMTTTMSIVVDSIIVGNFLGADALAAVNLVMPVMMAYNTTAVLLGLGAATMISIAKGQRKDDFANTIFTTTVLGMLLLSGLLLAAQALFLDDISHLLTREPTLQPLVRSYLHALLYGTPMIILTLGLTYCLRVDGRVKLASTILIVANVVNLALDLLYMGPLQLGVAGSSLATVSGYAVGAALLLSYVFSPKRTLRIILNKNAKPATFFKNMREIFATGSPAAMGSVLIMFKILAINTIVLSVAGTSGMVAFSVCISCLSLVSMFISGAAQAMNPIVGVLYGEMDYVGIRFVVKRALQVLLWASILCIAVLELWPEMVLKLFGVREAADLAEGVHAIRIFAVSLLGVSISFIAMYYYMTTGRRKLSNAIAIVQGFAVVVPVAYLLSRFMGSTGIWLAFPIAELATILMIAGCVIHMKRKYPEKYRSALLLDHSMRPAKHVLERSYHSTPAEAADAVQDVTTFLTRDDIPSETVSSVTLAVKELTSNIVRYADPTGKTPCFDLRVHVYETKIVIAVRDSGIDFNPATYRANPSQLKTGLQKIEEISDETTYSRTIGFNNNTMIFNTI